MRDRIVGSRVDVVTTMGELIRTGYPVDGVRISFDGDRGEAWDADFALSDPSTVPTTPMDILDGRSGCCLRVWWRVARAQGKMFDGGWLFPGQNPIRHLSTRQLNRAIHAAVDVCTQR